MLPAISSACAYWQKSLYVKLQKMDRQFAEQTALMYYTENVAWLRDPINVLRSEDIPINQGYARAAALFLGESLALTYPNTKYLANQK